MSPSTRIVEYSGHHSSSCPPALSRVDTNLDNSRESTRTRSGDCLSLDWIERRCSLDKLASLNGHANGDAPAFQVITLGASGGPAEDCVTGFLVRSTAQAWAKGSIMGVDAGSHLSSIIQILEQTQSTLHQPTTPLSSSANGSPPCSSMIDAHGPAVIQVNGASYPSHFQGLALPFKSTKANANYIFRNLVGGYCITHPHLDHISGLVINTAGIMPKDKKKVIAGLPTTIEALKNHVFNDIIWPNLTDENGGVGFLSYRRLVDASVIGGAIDYKPIVEGLSVQVWPVSHGHCMKNHQHRGSDSDLDVSPAPGIVVPRHNAGGHTHDSGWKRKCVYDSSCFFIRDDATGKELLIFGDVEPDSVSISIPRRNLPVWIYAADKIAREVLNTIFIECSYDIHQPDAHLYGHLTPKHIIDELQVLATKVIYYREQLNPSHNSSFKRRRTNTGFENLMQVDPFERGHTPVPFGIHDEAYDSETPRSPRDMEGVRYNHRRDYTMGGKRRRTDESEESLTVNGFAGVGELGLHPLKGLTVVIMHIKEDFDDERDVRLSILSNLRKLDAAVGLGVRYELAEKGGSMYF